MSMPFVDHHTHTLFSWDSETTVDELALSARKNGLFGVVITDHIEFHPSDRGFSHYNYEKALEAYEMARQTYPDLKIKFGAEISHHPKHLSEIRDFLKKRRFHFTIGSNHNIGWEEVPDYVSRLENEGDDFKETLTPYFEECLKLVESNLYDAIGHIDFPKRYFKKRVSSDFFISHYERIIRSILTASLDMGIFVEVNTAPYRVQINEPYPGWEILRLYRKLGGREVILSSDAHRPEDLGTAFDAVIKELSRMGISVRNGV
ncbi:MAG: histidinol-phosphatase HisJ family protein [Acidobacteriota bacterium]|nr:histidinol-phosphatase HisJ family protein [Thermoanaerobaculaceae bacterium]